MYKIFFAVVFFFLQAKEMSINNSWIRPAAEGMNTGLFFEIDNSGDAADTLYKVTSDLAEVVQIHETYQNEKNMMGMREVKFVAVDASTTIKFKPRSLHVMLIKLKHDLKIGDKGEVALHFKKAGIIKVAGTVQDMPVMKK